MAHANSRMAMGALALARAVRAVRTSILPTAKAGCSRACTADIDLIVTPSTVRGAQASLAPRVDGTWLWWNKEQVLGTLDRAFADRFGYTPTAFRARRGVPSDVSSRPKRANAPPPVTDLLGEEHWPSAAGLVDVPRGKRARGVLQSAS
jgi:hypothetical protein